MAEDHVVSALMKKYTEILTVLMNRDTECAMLREQLVTLAKAINIYKPGFNGSQVSPRRGGLGSHPNI
jgi:hypothetical protein